jgi:hypothetical protein
MIVYISFSLFLFFRWVAPSLDGRTDQHIAADSATYIYFAESLREGNADPMVIAAMASFPNTLWSPVLLALILKSTFAMVIANYLMLLASVLLLRKSFTFSLGTFLGLLALNPTTTISLLSVNKEIIDLLAVSMFFYSLRSHRAVMLLGSLVLALVSRYEVCIVMLLFLLAESRLNPWRRKRLITVAMLIVSLNFALPLLGSDVLSARFEEARYAGVVAWLDSLEMHYLYVVAVIPKILEGLFGQLAMSMRISYILWFNNLADVVVLIVLAKKRLLMARNDLVYFSMFGVTVMAISLIIQPRYFYFIYALLCLQVALMETGKPAAGISPHKRVDRGRDASVLGHKEAAFG